MQLRICLLTDLSISTAKFSGSSFLVYDSKDIKNRYHTYIYLLVLNIHCSGFFLAFFMHLLTYLKMFCLYYRKVFFCQLWENTLAPISLFCTCRVSGKQFNLQIKIRGYSLRGLLFWTSENLPLHEGTGDFLSLGFKGNELLFQYNLGSGRGVISYNKTQLSDGKWHTINAQRYQIILLQKMRTFFI